jgi:hypothetical protein
MTKAGLQPALDPGAILGKSRHYILKALRCKEVSDNGDYQLWASLALELLGKSCLARKHPSLVADPTHSISLLAASGINKGTDIKTITAKTLFERLHTLIDGFDNKVREYCNEISQRRNAELHSGELPFANMELASWEARYWHSAQLILSDMDLTLEEWLGADQAKSPKQIVEHARQAMADAARVRVETVSAEFQKRTKRDRESAVEESKTKHPYHYRGLFDFSPDNEWMHDCPSCGGLGILAGDQVGEEFTDDHDPENPWVEFVEKEYSADEFFCPVCQLRLNGQIELEACEIDTDIKEIEEREREYEPEYGND